MRPAGSRQEAVGSVAEPKEQVKTQSAKGKMQSEKPEARRQFLQQGLKGINGTSKSKRERQRAQVKATCFLTRIAAAREPREGTATTLNPEGVTIE